MSELTEIKKIFPEALPEQIGRLEAYLALLREWNQKINLVSRRDVENLVENHLWPSVMALQVANIPENSWLLDVGSGGGFPAIPLKILRPDVQVLMAESIRKKAMFLRTAIADLELESISVVNNRVENITQTFEFRKKFDIITARAVAPVPTLIQWTQPLLNQNGFWLLWKGSSDIPELERYTHKKKLHYQILTTPEEAQQYSAKFEHLRWFVIRTPR